MTVVNANTLMLILLITTQTLYFGDDDAIYEVIMQDSVF